ncbi:hypothetical protein KBX37_09935 [Micromonospora sp. U56]|uniref:hypothetical protein n=1 Tax=Micromonospora sp. U56 TaxID=2824900 RepID=UPI001B360582|nr:hypothetical protein [Micromonospora sp. U56]MBQ0893410.1 hypothetical protein [Micromonospora sp. U56]
MVIRVSTTRSPSPATGSGSPAGGEREVRYEYRVDGRYTIELDVPGIPMHLPSAVKNRAFTVRVICDPSGLRGSHERAGQPAILPITDGSGSTS